MPFDDHLADADFPLFPVTPAGANPGTPCFYNNGTFWTVEATIPPDFDWAKWVRILPKDYLGPVVLMNVKNGNVPHITQVPGRRSTAEAEDAEDRRLLGILAGNSSKFARIAVQRLYEFDRMHRMCEGCKLVCMDDQPHWMKTCKDCYYATKKNGSPKTRKCPCGASMENMEHWKTVCLSCFKKGKKARRYAPY